MMKNFLILIILVSLVVSVSCESVERGPRLIILADMGNEPDEEQQMMHMLMCCNELELVGLIAVTGKYLQPASKNPYKQKIHPELFHHLIEGYEKVYENLLQHASGKKISIGIPDNASGKEIHKILEVTDQSEIASLWDYRRVIFKVHYYRQNLMLC